MANYNVLSLTPDSLWVHALGLGFAHLARTNPGWIYQLTSQQEEGITPNLFILDLTRAAEIKVKDLPQKNSRLLILVHAFQRRLIRTILDESRCSLLCVDDHVLNFREIIETSARNKRFVSPFIREVMAKQSVPESSIALTDAETKVLNFILSGKSGVEISRALFRSQKTISSHKRNIMRKFGVRDDLGLKQKILALEERGQ